MQELIVGRWKTTQCDFSDPTDRYQGLSKDYYQMNIGRIVEFKKEGTMRWDEQAHWQSYSLDPSDSSICFLKDTIRIQSISGNTLVLKEIDHTKVLITTLTRLDQ
jgi:hypothetical protein